MDSINQKGVSLYLAIVVMIIVLGIAIGMTAISYKQIKGAQETGNSTIAFFAADTGVEQALKAIRDTSAMSVGGGSGLSSSYADTLSNGASYSTQITCCSSASCDSSCNFSNPSESCPPGLTEDANCLSPRFCIKSQGVFNGVKRAIESQYGRAASAGEYVLVPAYTNPYNGVHTPDFYVMKYEAKYDKDGDGEGDDAGNCYFDINYDTWDWGKTGGSCPSNWCGSSVVSTANGSPIAGITLNEAITACPSGTHLITNDEWVAIARNAELILDNWMNGNASYTSGCLFMGNVGSEYNLCSYNSGDTEKGTGRDARAKLVLSNSSEIWDISGNIWEWTNTPCNSYGSYYPGPGGGDFYEWNRYPPDPSPDLTDARSFAGPDSSHCCTDTNHGMGGYYGCSDPAAQIIRGGGFQDEGGSGLFALNSKADHEELYDVGFRCVRDY
jgi:hypothetical protein